MKYLNILAASTLALSLVAAPMAIAQDKKMSMDAFMKSCDMDNDGMVTKAEMMKHMEKMFDKMDTKKTGKLTKDQTAEFLKQFVAPSGG